MTSWWRLHDRTESSETAPPPHHPKVSVPKLNIVYEKRLLHTQNTDEYCSLKCEWKLFYFRSEVWLGGVDVQMAFNNALRDNLGQMWPTDPRHSWWKRNRCCASPEDCRVWTPDCESEAPILLSERSCPPAHDRKGEQGGGNRWDWQGGNERSSTPHRQAQRCNTPVAWKHIPPQVEETCATNQPMFSSSIRNQQPSAGMVTCWNKQYKLILYGRWRQRPWRRHWSLNPWRLKGPESECVCLMILLFIIWETCSSYFYPVSEREMRKNRNLKHLNQRKTFFISSGERSEATVRLLPNSTRTWKTESLHRQLVILTFHWAKPSINTLFYDQAPATLIDRNE